MTLKIVIKVQGSDKEHSTKKAMQIAAVRDGVTSITISGEEKDQLVVTGEGVDPVKLTSLIRKKVSRNASLVLVEEVKPKEDDKNPETQPASIPLLPWTNYYPYHYYPPLAYT